MLNVIFIFHHGNSDVRQPTSASALKSKRFTCPARLCPNCRDVTVDCAIHGRERRAVVCRRPQIADQSRRDRKTLGIIKGQCPGIVFLLVSHPQHSHSLHHFLQPFSISTSTKPFARPEAVPTGETSALSGLCILIFANTRIQYSYDTFTVSRRLWQTHVNPSRAEPPLTPAARGGHGPARPSSR